jgi:hypothetical protein
MSWGKFKLLLWKNFTIQKRHKIGGLFELVFPILLSLILSWARKDVKLLEDEEYHFSEFEIKNDFVQCS